jgi:sulfatase modifying factor 1
LRYDDSQATRPAACPCAQPGGGTGAQPALHDARLKDMVWIAGGRFLMGSDQFYREERPLRPASVDGFWIDATPVTNAAFSQFFEATGYLTVAERAPDPALYPDADASLLVAGSLVFTKPQGRVSLRDNSAWWAYVPGANWRHPQGPHSSIAGLEDHPVVHVSHEDVLAYAAWAGKSIPAEAEWEYAACGGLQGVAFPWGDEPTPGGQIMANTWQGEFPWENLQANGFEGTSPVRAFPPNGYGLYDMVGNVWEWTASRFETTGASPGKASCCGPGEAIKPSDRIVVKGGSHLCAPNYCLRFRPAARQGQTLDTSTSHIGFRCISK